MAFVSQVGLRNPDGHKAGQKKAPPFVVFRKSKSGACCGNLNRSMPFRGQRIDVQIDHEAKRIRIGPLDSGYRVEPKGGQFSCSIAVFNEIGTGRIWLELAEDGWWYGSYGAEMEKSDD